MKLEYSELPPSRTLPTHTSHQLENKPGGLTFDTRLSTFPAMTNISGPILFGYCLDIFLYGILTVQTYLYYLAFPKDRRMTKAIVYFVYIIGTVQTALALHDFYTLFCTPGGSRYMVIFPPYTDIHDVDRFGFMWFTIPVGGAIVTSVVQLFYAHRVYVISKVKLVTGIVCVLAILQLLCGICSAVSIFKPSQTMGVSYFGGITPFTGGVVGAACDLLIAIYMSRYLSRQMKGASRFTQVLVTKVVRLLLETGVLTAGMAMAYAILSFFVVSGLSWFMIPGLSLGKLYANSMLVLLNNRFTIPGGRNAPHPDFEVASYRRSDLAEVNAGPIVSHGIAFARDRRAETTPSPRTVHTVELHSHLRPVFEEPKEAGGERVETGSV